MELRQTPLSLEIMSRTLTRTRGRENRRCLVAGEGDLTAIVPWQPIDEPHQVLDVLMVELLGVSAYP